MAHTQLTHDTASSCQPRPAPRHQPDVVWLLYSTSFRIVEVRYREPTRVISFSPTYKAPPSQVVGPQ